MTAGGGGGGKEGGFIPGVGGRDGLALGRGGRVRKVAYLISLMWNCQLLMERIRLWNNGTIIAALTV